MIATGTSHSGMPAPTKPLSSSGFINAGNAGSVSGGHERGEARHHDAVAATAEVRNDAGDALQQSGHGRQAFEVDATTRLTPQLTIIPAAPAYNGRRRAAAGCGTSAAEANPQHFMVIPPETQQGPSRRRWLAGALAAGALHAAARAQFRVEISGVGATQLPVGVAKFREEDKSGQSISGIVRADFERSGVFRIVDSGGDFDETVAAQLHRVARPRRRRAGGRLGGAPGRWPLRRALQAVGRGQGRRPRRPGLCRGARPTCGSPRTASPTRCTRSSPATRACSRPASPTSRGWPTATRCASPMPTARAARWRSTARSRSSRRPGRPTASRSPTCRSKAARRWCGRKTWPAAIAARSPTSAAATARRRGRPMAARWPSRCRATASRRST